MHGYEIITELEGRTNGAWRPSSGSIYPTLSLLEDEGLVESSADSGRRRFSLTSAGEEQVGLRGDAPPPWEEFAANADPSQASLREAGALLFAALVQVGRAGTPEQVKNAATIVDATRRKLYGLLAEPAED